MASPMNAFFSQLMASHGETQLELVQDNAATHSQIPSQDRWSSIPSSPTRDEKIRSATERSPLRMYVVDTRFDESALIETIDLPRLPKRTLD